MWTDVDFGCLGFPSLIFVLLYFLSPFSPSSYLVDWLTLSSLLSLLKMLSPWCSPFTYTLWCVSPVVDAYRGYKREKNWFPIREKCIINGFLLYSVSLGCVIS